MKTRLIFICFICLSAFGFGQKSSVDFEIKNVGITVDGYFNTFTIDADFDANFELKNLSGKITTSSIKTGIDSRDEHLLEEDYFDVENHKYIILKSTTITKKTITAYNVKASLTIKGKTKTVTIPVTVEKVGDKQKITSNFEINRQNYDVGGGSFVMSKTVKINVIYYQ
ncbi:YceI family protein [Winogradskyella sp. R77965]|uniref:YceI family protein n=1 Tax=Winogradskyella sp. R77965 TaxID=3093872 RepID=UPI0037DC88B1